MKPERKENSAQVMPTDTPLVSEPLDKHETTACLSESTYDDRKSAKVESSVPSHIFYSSNDSVTTSILDHESRATSIHPPNPASIKDSASASPSKIIFRKFLAMPQGVQRRTQRVKVFLSSHRRSFSRHLRFRNRKERRTVISPKSIHVKRSKFIIRADHPFKIVFDLFTVILTLISIYVAHMSIRDRSTYEYTPFFIFNKFWFLLDIIGNFFTANVIIEPNGDILVVEGNARAVWALYLTSWFAVDVLSLIPWERLYIKPVIEMQNRRNLLVKSFFRTKAVIRLSTFLRARHIQYFGRVAHNTKHHLGMNTPRLLKLIIKYVPKYLLFYRNMKGILIIKALRLVHFIVKAFRAFRHLRMYLKEQVRKRKLTSVVEEQLVLGKNSQFGEITFQDLSIDDEISNFDKIKRSTSTLLSDGSDEQVVSEDDRLEQDDGSSFRTSDDENSLHGNDSWSELVSVDTVDSRGFQNETFDNSSQFE